MNTIWNRFKRVTPQNRGWIFVGIFIFSFVLYLPANHFPLFEPRLLEMGWVDRIIPFLPWTIWIYLSDLILPWVAFQGAKDFHNLNDIVKSYFILILTTAIVFFLFPTTFPRMDFALSGQESIHAWALVFFRTIDAPTNCAPSLHVSVCFMSAFIYIREQREKLPFFLIWAVAIAISTMTTKQHYFFDVWTGAGLATLSYLVIALKSKSLKSLKISTLLKI